MSKTHRVLSIVKQAFRKYIRGEKNIIIDIDRFASRRAELSCQYTNLFVQKNIKRFIANDLNIIDGNQFDCVISGSDQVWRFYGGEKALKDNYLEFTEGWKCRRIAYAVSFGFDKLNYPEELKTQCKQLVKNFNAISVRETSGIEICKTEFNINAVHVLDPTLLLKKEDYLNLIKYCKTDTHEGGLLYYILDDDKKTKQIIREIAFHLKKQAYSVSAESENHTIPFDWRIQPPVEEWLKGFADAEFVITDSFHACVFSIIFNKPFICIGNEQRGMTRFHSLLSMFDLQKQLVDIKHLNIKRIKNTTIDWNNINEKLNNLRNFSYQFLIKNITK